MSSLKAKIPSSNRALARLRLDARLQPLRANQGAMAIPRGGWLRAIRNALGMSLEDMAGRLGITRSSALRIETSEDRGTIQLDTLRRTAEALNCELVYVLIPKLPLEKVVEQQRLKLARQRNAKVHTHMLLEGQDTQDASLDTWRLDRAVASIPDRELWKLPK
jgi:predicted DNA-binding mobile mystery protein A